MADKSNTPEKWAVIFRQNGKFKNARDNLTLSEANKIGDGMMREGFKFVKVIRQSEPDKHINE